MAFPIPFAPATPTTERFTLERRQQGMESPHSYAFQVVHGASRWTLEWSWPRMRLPQAEAVSAWGLSLRGQIGTFRYHPRQTITSTLTGRTLALAGYGYNTSVKVGGWTANSLSTLRVGQWFTLGAQLLRIVDASALADGNGHVTITFEPEIRVAIVPAGTAVEFANPYGVFRFASPTGVAYTLDPDKLPDFGMIQAIEAVTTA